MDSPGTKALEAVKNLKDPSVFKKPIGFAKRKKKLKVLDEDTYIEKMGVIIQRDFFPYLEKLQAQNKYLDALEQNDIKKMRELYEKYSADRPSTDRPFSPATFETPLHRENNSDLEDAQSTAISSSSTMNNVTNETKVGLDSYLSKHTSEDNVSFQEIIKEAEKKHRLKYAWLYKEDKPQVLSIKGPDNKNLAIADKDDRPNSLCSWAYKDKNYIMYVPDGVQLTADEEIEMAKKKRAVVHENTRLVVNPFNEQRNEETISELAKTQSKADNGKIGVDGKEITQHSTPRINGFSFVATPSPRPGEMDSPLMTWGAIEGTPFRLDGGDTPLLRTSHGPSFKMAEPPKREQLALQLAEKAKERHRDRKTKALEAARRSLATPSPCSTISRLNTMSPAARRLATQKLRLSCSPSPLRSALTKSPCVGVRTPNSTRSYREAGKNVRHEESVLTDNLLKLPPQRQRAMDFFDN